MTTIPLTPMTELQAVNAMLMSIGQAPVNTLDVAGVADVSIAHELLHQASLEVQSEGFSFNSDYEFELTPDANDNILIPADAVELDPCDRTKDFVSRDNGGTQMMYDRRNNTFVILEKAKFNIIRIFDFETIPQSARSYIAVKAARRFQAQAVGSRILNEFKERDEFEARAAFYKSERRVGDTNILRGGRSSTNNIVMRRI